MFRKTLFVFIFEVGPTAPDDGVVQSESVTAPLLFVTFDKTKIVIINKYGTLFNSTVITREIVNARN